jgi:hypothetical protein
MKEKAKCAFYTVLSLSLSLAHTLNENDNNL